MAYYVVFGLGRNVCYVVTRFQGVDMTPYHESCAVLFLFNNIK